MTDFGPWLVLAALGAYHGLNPGMGWLFAVALGLQERRAGVVLRALVPIALGHEQTSPHDALHIRAAWTAQGGYSALCVSSIVAGELPGHAWFAVSAWPGVPRGSFSATPA